MNLMPLVKLVLDDEYAAIPLSEAQKDAKIKEEMASLGGEYARLNQAGRLPIDYKDPIKRFAYIYKYTVAHADYIMQLIGVCPELQAALRAPYVSVACLGGGPGSDLLGVLKHLMLHKPGDVNLTCYLSDRERAWGDSWSSVAPLLDRPIRLNTVFQQMDVTNEAEWRTYYKFLKADIFTLSYFLSEVWSERTRAEPFFDYCFSGMRSGALLLFVDNDHTDFLTWFDGLAKRHRLAIVKSHQTVIAFSNDEEKRDLEPYFTKFGWPKRESKIGYRVARKE